MRKLLLSCPFTVSARLYLRIVVPLMWVTWACWLYVYLETYGR